MKISTSRFFIKSCLLGGVLSLSSFASTAHAIVVAFYNFPVAAGTTLPSASTDADAATTASSLSFGAGINGPGGISTQNASDYHLFLKPVANSTEGNAFTAGTYFTFTVTPGATPLSFSSFNFDYELNSLGGEFYALYASPTGAFISGQNVGSGTLTITPSAFLNASVDLAGVAALQNVATTTTFRLYVWGGSDGTQVTRFDNITVNAVPENGTICLLGLGLGGLAASRRRRTAR